MKMRSALLVLLMVAVPAGCGRTTSSSATAPHGAVAPNTLTLIAVDNSGSTEAMRHPLVAMAYDEATNLTKGTDGIKAYAFAGDIKEVTSEVPTDENAFAALLTASVLPTSKDNGTDYSKVLMRLAEDSATSSAPSIRVIVAGDGLTDFNSAAVDYRFAQAAKALAANPRIRLVLFYGVKVGARERLEHYLKGGTYQLRFIDLGEDLSPLP